MEAADGQCLGRQDIFFLVVPLRLSLVLRIVALTDVLFVDKFDQFGGRIFLKQ